MKVIKNNNNFFSLGQNNSNLVKTLEIIIDKTTTFKNLNFVLDQKEEPKYCYTSAGKYNANHCYVPFKFKKDDLFQCIEKNFKTLNIANISELYIMLHEIGHAKQHETLGDSNPYYYPVIIKQGNNLHYLYNGGSSENSINQFISENYKEAFADCFAAFALYKEFGNIVIFDKISDIRKERKNNFKNLNGNEFIHSNEDYHSIKYLKKIIEKIGKPHNEITYSEIEHYLETSLLRGSIKTIKTELEKNDAFLIAFRDFSQEFSYFKKDSYRLKEFEKTLKEENSLISERESQNIIEKIKNSSILGFFIEFKKRSESNHIISNKTIIDFSKNKNFERLVKPKTIIKITTPFMILDGEPKSGFFDSKIKTIEPYFQGKQYNEKN